MKKLYKLILQSFVGPFFATFFIALFLFLMQFLWKYVDEMVGKGLPWYVIAELIFYASASLVPTALPLAVLLSSIMTYGNLGEQYELVAIKSAGISLQKSMRPLVVLMVIVSGSAFFIANNLIPVANLKMFALLYDVRQKKPTVNIKEGVFFNDIEGYSIKIAKKDKDQRTIHDVIIYANDKNGLNISVMTAEHGTMDMSPDKRYIYFTLYNGHRYSEMNDKPSYHQTYPHNTMHFGKQEMVFDLTDFNFSRTKESLFKDDSRMQNINQLLRREDSLLSVMTRKAAYTGQYVRQFLHLDTTTRKNIAQYQADTVAPPDILASLPFSVRDLTLNQAKQNCRIINEALINVQIENTKIAEQRAKHSIEIQRKFVIAVACIVLFFIGAPLGAIIRKGGLGMPLVVSVAFFIIYYVINMSAEKMCKKLVVEAHYGMWLSTVVLLPVGVFLTYKASVDSALFDRDAYRRFFRRVGGLFRKS